MYVCEVASNNFLDFVSVCVVICFHFWFTGLYFLLLVRLVETASFAYSFKEPAQLTQSLYFLSHHFVDFCSDLYTLPYISSGFELLFFLDLLGSLLSMWPGSVVSDVGTCITASPIGPRSLCPISAGMFCREDHWILGAVFLLNFFYACMFPHLHDSCDCFQVSLHCDLILCTVKC